jgi:hypothetical protein
VWKAKADAAKAIDLKFAAHAWFKKLGLTVQYWAKLDKPGAYTSWVPRFLNRLLGMPLAQQNILFECAAARKSPPISQLTVHSHVGYSRSTRRPRSNRSARTTSSTKALDR